MELSLRGERNVKVVPLLVEHIQHLADPRALTETASCPLPRRRYLVYINPVGGAGKASQTFKTVVEPSLPSESH
ncbi:hypothetical protein PINS_up014762 [Pythium insidiosum]|nr:hypothetical protein PINS_up014762 [Pythium insidiosum]